MVHGLPVRITSLALGRGDHLLGVGYADGRVAVWNLAAGRHLFLRQQHHLGTAVKALSFDAAGRRLATTGADSQVFLLDAIHGKQLAALRGSFGAVDDAAFSPSGHWLVTAGPSSAGFWDLSTAQRLLFLDGHTGPLLAVTFDRTGRRISTVGSDASMRAYSCEVCGGTNDLVRLARTRLDMTGRTLTPAERGGTSPGHEPAYRCEDRREPIDGSGKARAYVDRRLPSAGRLIMCAQLRSNRFDLRPNTPWHAAVDAHEADAAGRQVEPEIPPARQPSLRKESDG